MILGLDIGGANLELATDDGRAVSAAFPLWRLPETLAARLRELAEPLGEPERVAVTMTGELADCFATKAEGVDRILASVESAFAGKPIAVWSTAGRFVSPREARERPLETAAANWHAQASWAGRFVPQGTAVLIDIGSTTTDLIPLRDGMPCPQGRTDPARLLSRELVYRGVRRTPLMALRPVVSAVEREIPAAAELFATTLDVFLVLGELPEDETDCDTANGRPATKACAHDRIARMACSDRTEFSWDDVVAAARRCREVLRLELERCLRAVLARTPASSAITSGSGEFLARQLVESAGLSWRSLSQELSPQIAEAACAYAVAMLARTQALTP
jgi:probable H4MPT-linked C1 transfer pathway protein